MASLLEFIQRTTPTPAASPKAYILFDGGIYYNAIDATPGSPTLGHFMGGPDNARVSRLITDLEGLRVESQKNGWMVMAAGIVQNINGGGMTGEDYVHRALLSAEVTLSYRNDATVLGHLYTGPNGSFPAHGGLNGVPLTTKQDRYHNKNMVTHKLGTMFELYRDSSLNGNPAWAAYTARVDVCETQLAEYAAWASIDGPGSNIDEFFLRAGNVNQLMSCCHFLEITGKLLGDAGLRAMGQTRLEQIFYGTATQDPNISPDGVIYEKRKLDGIGFDGSYMSFSLEELGDIYLSLPAGAWKDAVGAQLAESTTRWMQTISPLGVVSTLNPNRWTRVKETFPRKPGMFPKGWNWDGISYRLLYLNYILGDGVVPPGLADLVTNIGKAFGHLDGLDDPEGVKFFSILQAADATAVAGLSNVVPWAGIRPIQRVGGGACADYPGGTLPNPLYIVPVEVTYDILHVEHSAYLILLPLLEASAIGFPPEL